MQRTKTIAQNKRLCFLGSGGSIRVGRIDSSASYLHAFCSDGENTHGLAPGNFFPHPVFRSPLRMLQAAVRRRPARQITPRKRGADSGLHFATEPQAIVEVAQNYLDGARGADRGRRRAPEKRGNRGCCAKSYLPERAEQIVVVDVTVPQHPREHRRSCANHTAGAREGDREGDRGGHRATELVEQVVDVTVPQNREEVVQCTPQDLVLNRRSPWRELSAS